MNNKLRIVFSFWMLVVFSFWLLVIFGLLVSPNDEVLAQVIVEPDEQILDEDNGDDYIDIQIIIIAEDYNELIDQLESVIGEFEDYFEEYGQISLKETEKALRKLEQSIDEDFTSEATEEMIGNLEYVLKNALIEIDELKILFKKGETKLSQRRIKRLSSLGNDLEDIKEQFEDLVDEYDECDSSDKQNLGKIIEQVLEKARSNLKAAEKTMRETEKHEMKLPVRLEVIEEIIDEHEKYRKSITIQQDFDASRSLTDSTSLVGDKTIIFITNDIGGVTVSTRNSSELNAELIVNYSEDSRTSSKTAEEVKLVLNVTESGKHGEGRIDIEVAYPQKSGKADHIVSSHLYVEMPANNPLRISNSFGLVNVSGLKNNLKIKASFSEIELDGIDGDIDVSNSSGGIYVGHITGRVDITNSFGPIEAIGINGDAVFNNSYAPVIVEKSTGSMFINTSGEVQVSHHNGNVEIQSSNATLEIYDLTGDLIAINSFGKIETENITGNAEIENNTGPIDINGVGGHVSVSSNFSPITIVDVKNGVDVESSNGKISIEKCEGTIDVNGRFDKIDIEAIEGDIIIENTSKSIAISEINGNAHVSNQSAPIMLYEISGDIDVENKNSSIDMVDIGGNCLASTSYGLIAGENLQGTFRIDNTGGSIELSRIAGIYDDCKIAIRDGDIRLDLPEDSKFNLSAQTTLGKIRSDFPISVSTRGNITIGELIAGQSYPNLTIRGKNSSIRISSR